MKLFQCPMCHGEGKRTMVILDDGTGPSEICGYCEGTGEIDQKLFYQCLGWLSSISKSKRKYARLTHK